MLAARCFGVWTTSRQLVAGECLFCCEHSPSKAVRHPGNKVQRTGYITVRKFPCAAQRRHTGVSSVSSEDSKFCLAEAAELKPGPAQKGGKGKTPGERTGGSVVIDATASDANQHSRGVLMIWRTAQRCLTQRGHVEQRSINPNQTSFSSVQPVN